MTEPQPTYTLDTDVPDYEPPDWSASADHASVMLRLCAYLAKRATVNGCDHESHELSTSWLDRAGWDFGDNIYSLTYTENGETKRARCDCEVLRCILPEIIGMSYDTRTLYEKMLPQAEALVAQLGIENAKLYPAGEYPDDYDELLND